MLVPAEEAEERVPPPQPHTLATGLLPSESELNGTFTYLVGIHQAPTASDTVLNRTGAAPAHGRVRPGDWHGAAHSLTLAHAYTEENVLSLFPVTDRRFLRNPSPRATRKVLALG